MKISKKTPEEIRLILADAYLNIEIDEKRLSNPLIWPSYYAHAPEQWLSYIMTRPEYFSIICREIMGITLLPTQAVILAEMWKRKFPMLIASRGFGKMLESNTLIRIQNGWQPIKNIHIGDLIYGSDGKLTRVTNKTKLQKNLKFYKITLRDNRTIRCCEDHLWKVWDKYKNHKKDSKVYSTISTKEMFENFKINRIGEKSNGTEFRYALPINKPLMSEIEQDYLLHPYIVGVLLGDGCLAQETISFTTLDKEVANKVNELLPVGYIVKQGKDIKTFRIIRSDKNLPAFHYIIKKIGLFGLYSYNKFIPEEYQYGSYEQKLELIRGLMDTDGYSDKSVKEYYTISKQLSDDFLNVARSLGLHCKHKIKESWLNNTRYSDCNVISIYTNEEIFSISRKLDYLNYPISKQGQSKYEKVFIVNIEEDGYDDGYCITVDNPDHTYITKDYIVTHNSFMSALYILLRLLLLPGRKVVIAGSAFRQSKIIFNYMETIYENSPLLKDIIRNCGGTMYGPRRQPDMWTFNIGKSVAMAIPVGPGGEKIRGLRANDLFVDEFNSVGREVFEVVMAGFMAVSNNPIENVKNIAQEKLANKLGINLEEYTDVAGLKTIGNQMMLSGTAGYKFQHFYEYWQDWHDIICSGGDKTKLERYIRKKQHGSELTEDDILNTLDYRDYSIIRIPFDLIPEGFMDAAVVARAKATMHSGNYQCEYGATFSDDSNGFFKRSLIESCVVGPNNIISRKGIPDVRFNAVVHGDLKKKYIMGIDPASEIDKFAVTILELWPDHARVVYCWSTNKAQYAEEKRDGLVDEHDYYVYCYNKIRWLMKSFPIERIMLDSQGGGHQLAGMLGDPKRLNPGENVILPVIIPDKPQETDIIDGLHILELCNFANPAWYEGANHGLRYALESKQLLFPYFDALELSNAEMYDDLIKYKTYDNLEFCITEIEEMKTELSMIVVTKTSTGKDRWDTPEIKEAGGRKGRLRKDRYSALLMANAGAMYLRQDIKHIMDHSMGDWAGQSKNTEGLLYSGNTMWAKAVVDAYSEYD